MQKTENRIPEFNFLRNVAGKEKISDNSNKKIIGMDQRIGLITKIYYERQLVWQGHVQRM